MLGLSKQQELKINVAKAAIKYVPEGQIIGVGTGSTINYFIDELYTIKDKIKGAVASSEATAIKLKKAGIPVITLNDINYLDIYIDGADEINISGAMIKGGGAALTREKIIASMAKFFVCIVDSSKVVDHLGKFPLPIEIIPMASGQITRQIATWGGQASLRMSSKKNDDVLITDNGNVILDVTGISYDDAKYWESKFNSIVGVVTVGLFAARAADIALISHDSRVVTKEYSKKHSKI
jgi:ribose 5-phosphate isomerase A